MSKILKKYIIKESWRDDEFPRVVLPYGEHDSRIVTMDSGANDYIFTFDGFPSGAGESELRDEAILSINKIKNFNPEQLKAYLKKIIKHCVYNCEVYSPYRKESWHRWTLKKLYDMINTKYCDGKLDERTIKSAINDFMDKYDDVIDYLDGPRRF